MKSPPFFQCHFEFHPEWTEFVWTGNGLCIRARQIFSKKCTPQDRLYLGEKKRSISKNFFFRWSFGLEKTKNVIFLKFEIGGSGGVQKNFWLYQWLSGEILTCFALKSFSVAPRKGLFSFRHKRFIWSTLSFLELQKNFLGLSRSEFLH